LEDSLRGSPAEVRESIAEYVRLAHDAQPVIDVGCGRGEWLEQLRDAGIEAYGVDINAVVVERCQALGLDVREADALVHLREIPEGSARAITSFHVVEHLSLDTLIGLIDAALVALQPGGVLIFETPNPTNVNVGAASFYLDPTHLKPLHPQFLEFLVAQRGFADAEVRYLNIEDGPSLSVDDLAPNGELARSQELVDRVNWALSGPLDYCVIARKAPAAPGA
jgi:O-antigen chain-terminating methyltransferase